MRLKCSPCTPAVTERRYRIADRVVASDLDLPARTVGNGVPAWRVIKIEAAPEPGIQYHAWHRNGRPYLTVARAGNVRVLHARGVATFVIDDHAREIQWHASRRASVAEAQSVLVNHILPLVLARERLVLHASAVVLENGVIGFLGSAGRGKSTLAAALARAGAAVVADDALVVEKRAGQLVAVPFGTGARLWPDSASALLGSAAAHALPRVRETTPKRHVPERGTVLRFEQRPAPLTRLYLLDVPSARRRTTRIDVLTGVDAVLGLVSYALQLDLDDPRRIRATFERVLDLVQEVPIRRLRVVQRLDALDDVVAIIRNDLR